MLDELSKTIDRLLPPEAGRALRAQLEAAIRAQAEALNLVTRDRFDAQEKVLQRTRARVQELERQVTELERLQRAEDEARTNDAQPPPA